MKKKRCIGTAEVFFFLRSVHSEYEKQKRKATEENRKGNEVESRKSIRQNHIVKSEKQTTKKNNLVVSFFRYWGVIFRWMGSSCIVLRAHA